MLLKTSFDDESDEGSDCVSLAVSVSNSVKIESSGRLGEGGNQCDRADVLLEFVHADFDFERFVVVGLEREGVVARSHIVEAEPAFGVGGRPALARGEGDLHLLDGRTVAARDDLALDAAALRGGRERRHRQKQCE